jgi:fucose permease
MKRLGTLLITNKLAKNKILLNISLFYALFLIGANYSMVGPILIELSQKVGVKIELMGYFFSMVSAGFITGSFSTSLLGRFNIRNKILLASNLLLSSSILLLALSKNFSTLLISAFFIGLSGGLIESNVTVTLAEIYKDRESQYINISQAFFSFGAFIGPFLITFLTGRGFNISVSFIIMSSLCMLNFVLLLFVKIPSGKSDLSNEKSKTSIFKGISPVTIFLVMSIFLTMFFYVCFESGVNSWIPTFLRLHKSFSALFAGNAIAFFWLTITAGRFLIGFISTRVRVTYLLLTISTLMVITFKLSTVINNSVLIIILLILTGLLMAGVWPLIVSLCVHFSPKSSNFLVPLIVMTGGIGGIFSPWVIGIVYDKFNIAAGINIVFVFSIIIVVFVIGTIILENYNNKK